MDATIQPASRNGNRLALAGACTILVIVAVTAYWPGLRGPFLLDDFGSLAALGDLGGVRDWETLKAFVFGGFTGPSGRPLALLTFLLDGTDWPTDPWPFKRTNLVIHLLNGLLLAVVSAQILRLSGIDKQRASWLALLCAACWVVHPFLVSTTLYPVQRMAQLAALFVFSGMILYLYGRSLLATYPKRAYLTMSVAVGLFTALGLLSKENGVLLPLLIGVLEFTVIASRRHQYPALHRAWTSLFLALPSLVVLVYIGKFGLSVNFFEANPPRDFSAYERLLTESRVMIDYLRHWFLPVLYTPGIFQDHFLKSSGLLSPVTTVLSIAFHLAVVTICVVRRREWPLFAFCFLFFYSAHLLESTILNLELYFEHRNYLPAAFLFVPAIVFLNARINRSALVICGVTLVCLLTSFTAYTARIWESYPAMVETSARVAPTSARAQQQYSMVLLNSQQPEKAMHVIDEAIERMPEKQSLHLWRVAMSCEQGKLTADEFSRLIDVVAAKPYDLRNLGSYQTIVNLVVDEKCPDVSIGQLRNLFVRTLAHPVNADPASPMFSQIRYFIGVADIRLGQPDRAMQNFEQSLESRPGAGRAMAMAALFAANGFYDKAAAMAETALSYKRKEQSGEIRASQVMEKDIRAFQAQVREEVEKLQRDAPPANR